LPRAEELPRRLGTASELHGRQACPKPDSTAPSCRKSPIASVKSNQHNTAKRLSKIKSTASRHLRSDGNSGAKFVVGAPVYVKWDRFHAGNPVLWRKIKRVQSLITNKLNSVLTIESAIQYVLAELGISALRRSSA
jgi:hypothetical protein